MVCFGHCRLRLAPWISAWFHYVDREPGRTRCRQACWCSANERCTGRPKSKLFDEMSLVSCSHKVMSRGA